MEVNKENKIFCAYVRVSTEFQTVENQVMDIENFCKMRNIKIVEWFKDEGLSAFKNRPSFEQMKVAIAAHLFNGVIAVKLDRIGRNLLDLCKTMNFFRENKCDVVFVRDNIDTTTPIGRFFFYLQSAFAEYEAELIRERTKMGLARVKLYGSKSGKPTGRPKEKIKDELLRKMYEDENKGLILIHKSVGLSVTAIRYRLIKMGVKIRTENFGFKGKGDLVN